MKKTILYDEHCRRGARMVEFAGYLMPLVYTGIAEEHAAVRESSGLFDVSHMGEIRIRGKDANRFVNHLLTCLVPEDGKGRMFYGFLLDDDGGVVDDLMVYVFDGDDYLLVVNAANKDKDFAWINSHKGAFEVSVSDESDLFSQLALQGPLSREVLGRLTDYPLDELKLFGLDHFRIAGKEFMVSRSGYTGEDGFEIYGSNADILALFRELAEEPEVSLCGLGCRDTLRFEAAMPLYGHEIGPEINPLAAGLGFAVNLEKDFIGSEALKKIKAEGPKERIVALELKDRGIAREGYEVVADGETIGRITTGYLLPGRETALAFALVRAEFSEIGTEVAVRIRRNLVPAVVRNRKFLKKKYIR